MTQSEVSPVIEKLVRLRTQQAALFEKVDKDAAVLKDCLENFHASFKDTISKAEKIHCRFNKRAKPRTEDLAKVWVEKLEVADYSKDALYEYVLYMEKHPTDPDGGLTAFLDSVDLSVNEWKLKSIDILMKYMQLEMKALNNDLVKSALNSAIEAYKGKKLDGTPVIDRLICTAVLLASSSDSEAVVASGLLLHHPVLDTMEQFSALENKFGKEVSCLVRDVSKLSKLSEISREEEFENPNRMPDLILAMVADARAVMIKIAEHVVQMVTLDTLNSKQKQRFVNESSRMHIPLAERLRLDLWKNQLENLCATASDELEKLYASVSERDVDGKTFKEKLESALNEEQLPFIRVESRKKSLRSTLKKMQTYRSIEEKEKNKMPEDSIVFSTIRDIIGLRIIVKNEGECYKAKDVVKKLWDADPEFEKDYIQKPKEGYRSLHVSVKNKKEQYMEVQIRTEEMHEECEDAHCFYKEGNLQVPEYIKEVVKFAYFVNRKEIKVTSIEGNSSTHQPSCPYAKLSKPPCLDATGVCKLPKKGPVYVIVKAKNKVTIKEHPTGTLLRTLCKQEGWEGRVIVNEEDKDLDYMLIVGDVIKFVSFNNKPRKS